MVDKVKIKKIKTKLKDKSFKIEDIPSYLDIMTEICNETNDIKQEVEGWNCTIQSKIGDKVAVWFKIQGAKFSNGRGEVKDPNITLEIGEAIGAGIFTGDQDPANAYLSGDLKVLGEMEDAMKFGTVVDKVHDIVESI